MSGNHLPNPIPPRVRRHASLGPDPAHTARGFPGACTRGRPSRNGCCAVQAVCTAFTYRGTKAYSDRPLEHASAPLGPGPGERPCPVPHPAPERPRTTPRTASSPARVRRAGAARRTPHPRPGTAVHRRTPPAPSAPSAARGRRRGVGRRGAGDGGVPAAAARSGRARRGRGPRAGGSSAGGGTGSGCRRRLRERTPPGRQFTGRLTGFRAVTHLFSANFWPPQGCCVHHPPTPVPPARKGSTGARAPYVDWPLRQGALPCTAHECNAS